MHNKIISWNDNWILIFLFVLWVDSFFQLHHLLHSSFLIQIIKMDKRLFKNWFLHFPHRLRDLLWIVRAWYSVAPIFSYLIRSRASSCVHSSQSPLKVINSFLHTFLEWMNPMILGGHNSILFFFDCFIIASKTSFWCLQGWDDL